MNGRIVSLPLTRCDNLFPYSEEEKYFKTAEGTPITTVFVTNMSHYTKKKELINHCSQIGPVENAKLIKRVPKKAGPLYGFVTFRNPVDAAKTVKGSFKVVIRQHLLIFYPADSWHQSQTSVPESADEEEVEVQQNSSACSISMLNDDCLRLIFDLFSIEERLVLGKVCKRWSYLNDLYWKSLTELDFCSSPLDSIRFNVEVFEQILSHCPNLVKLRLKQPHFGSNNSSMLVPIGKNCKKLEDLSIHFCRLHKRCLVFIADSCPNLRMINFHSVVNIEDHELAFFLEKCNNLESLRIDVTKTHVFTWFKCLKPPLKALHISTDHCDTPNFYEGLNRIKKTLRYLSIDHCKSFTSEQLNFIAENLPDLEALSLKASLSVRYSGLGKMEILKLKKLKSLDLSFCETIERQFLIELAQNCVDLEILNLQEVKTMECSGRSLEEFRSLKNLNLGKLPYLTDTIVIALSRKLSKLETIVLSGSLNITDNAVIAIIQNCHNIKNIEVAKCSRVTSRTIMAALDVLLSEKQRRTITMCVAGTGISQEEWDHDPSFENYIRLDFSLPPEMQVNFENDIVQLDFFSDEDDNIFLFDSDSD